MLHNSCDGGSSTDLHLPNYMDYSMDQCQNMFTADQKTRAIGSLTTLRASYLESNGNMSLVPPSTAVVNFNANSSIICIGQTVDFTDLSSCSPNTFLNTPWTGITFNWSITNNAGTTYTSSLQNPTIIFANAGTYDVSLTITNVNGTSSYTRQGMVVVSAAPVTAICTGTSTSTSTFAYGIYSVALNGMTHTSSSTYNDIQSGLTNASGYGDFSCEAGTILEPNTTYTIALKGTSATTLLEDFKVFIDYNNDGDFGDIDEEVAFFDNITGSSAYLDTTFTTTINPSLNVPLRMRVFSARNTETITSCGTTTRGQIQDYSVRISDKIAKVSISVSPNDTINYGTNLTFTASPTNGGTSPVYRWYKNNVLIVGANAVTYSSTTLNDADEIYCEMISNLADVIASPCTSNVVLMDVTGAVGLSNMAGKIEFEMNPNPASEMLNIKLLILNNKQATISIENMLGQMIYITQTTQQLNQFNISTFEPGVYFVRVQMGNTYSVKRLVIN
ncbi:MAG: T9SS type A sorting domain-containing protein [Bacteroidetes bacterium]|nr:T9SS type A sorting domain-containing protein [Bacteroidota bacterium]